uniref:non-specific serine/threonine protein kinase n=1 Tax=Oryza rufipogon TaxID=4529 RepID=A0A0E0NTN2_ORYRU
MDGNAKGGGHSEALKNYNLGRTLGIGSFGKVKIAEHKLTGHRVAIKILNRRQMRNMEMEEKAKREIKILRLFIHPHIIRLYEVISGKLYAGPEVDVWSCGVILYALLCGTLPFDDENIPNLFKKIKGGIYTLPSHLSALARDLIPRMLVVDPMKRITIREIREHQWFQIRLPRYLAVPPPDTAQQAKMIDEDTLQDVVNLGYGKDHVCESLRNRLQNEERNFNRFASSESASSNTRHYLPGSSDPHASGLRPHYPVERKWALGLQSRAQPREIMIEVLKALQDLNVSWKKNGQYNMKCRWSVGTQATDMLDVNNSFVDDSIIMDNGDVNGRLPAVIKFEIQLYKTRDEKYLLDMQRVTGPQLLFLDFCADFLTKLRVL